MVTDANAAAAALRLPADADVEDAIVDTQNSDKECKWLCLLCCFASQPEKRKAGKVSKVSRFASPKLHKLFKLVAKFEEPARDFFDTHINAHKHNQHPHTQQEQEQQ